MSKPFSPEAEQRGRLFAERRQELSISFEEAAIRTTRSAAFFKKVESGETGDPGISALPDFAQAYQLSVPEVLHIFGIDILDVPEESELGDAIRLGKQILALPESKQNEILDLIHEQSDIIIAL